MALQRPLAAAARGRQRGEFLLGGGLSASETSFSRFCRGKDFLLLPPLSRRERDRGEGKEAGGKPGVLPFAVSSRAGPLSFPHASSSSFSAAARGCTGAWKARKQQTSALTSRYPDACSSSGNNAPAERRNEHRNAAGLRYPEAAGFFKFTTARGHMTSLPNTNATTASNATTTPSFSSSSSSSSSSSAPGSTGEESSDDGSAHLCSKLDELVRSTAVVLFMKGSPQAPQCGFSARAVAILEAIDIADYTFINILKYPQIRTLAKKHFGWPTYPLLIVGGEVVGGVDIMEELNKTGQLRQDIQKAVEKHKGTQGG